VDAETAMRVSADSTVRSSFGDSDAWGTMNWRQPPVPPMARHAAATTSTTTTNDEAAPSYATRHAPSRRAAANNGNGHGNGKAQRGRAGRAARRGSHGSSQGRYSSDDDDALHMATRSAGAVPRGGRSRGSGSGGGAAGVASQVDGGDGDDADGSGRSRTAARTDDAARPASALVARMFPGRRGGRGKRAAGRQRVSGRTGGGAPARTVEGGGGYGAEGEEEEEGEGEGGGYKEEGGASALDVEVRARIAELEKEVRRYKDARVQLDQERAEFERDMERQRQEVRSCA